MAKREPVQYVFWPYDLFPHMVGARVERTFLLGGRRRYVPEGYGGVSFDDTKAVIVPGAKGAQLLETLRSLALARSVAMANMDDGFNGALASTLRILGVRHPKEVV
jgi:hypothetical protein